MKPASSTRGQTYAASQRKTFHSTLCQLLHKEFPGTFGPTVTRLFAEQIDALYQRCHPPLSRVRVGQVLWLAVAADERPSRSKRIEDTQLVPVLLDLVTRQDIDDASIPGKRLDTRRAKIVRLFRQAYEQGAVLSHADVSLLMHLEASTISGIVLEHEQTSEESLPRRGTIHDLGRSVSHKAVICYKRLVEKKTTSQVAEETFHSPEEVEYYVQCYRRVQLCSDNGMSVEDIALATAHSLHLVKEYLDLHEEFGLPRQKNARRKDGVQPKKP
jgi:hypothetical protein